MLELGSTVLEAGEEGLYGEVGVPPLLKSSSGRLEETRSRRRNKTLIEVRTKITFADKKTLPLHPLQNTHPFTPPSHSPP
jgi:hypothetical protein